MLTSGAIMWRDPLVTKNKGRARGLLYGSILLALVLFWLVRGKAREPLDIDTRWAETDFASMESVQLLQDYLRIDTSYPSGNEVPGAEFLAGHLEAAGIETHIERLGERNANLWAILEGENPEAIVLHNHIDVDPIRLPEAWPYPPFAGEIAKPWLFGRGAFDMKSVTIAQLMAFIELKKSGIRPRQSVIFLATGDEETESWLGTRWILREHPELVERFGYVLTEGGAVEATDARAVTYWGTEFVQKRYIEIRACHVSRERLEGLREDLLEHRAYNTEWRVSEPARRFFEIYGKTRRFEKEREILASPDDLRHRHKLSRIASYLQAMLRDEAHPFAVEEASGGYSLRIILHLLPGTTVEDGLQLLLPDWMTHGVPYSIEVPHGNSDGSSPEHEIFATMDGLLQEMYPGTVNGPLFVPQAATDARFFRAAGIPAYGLSPFLILSVDTHQMTGPGERIALPGYVDGVEFYIRLLQELAI